MAKGRETRFIFSAEDRTVGAFNSVRRNVKGLESAFSGLDSIASRLPLIGAAATAAFGAASFTGAIKASIDYADRLNDLTKSTGLTVEALSGLNLLAKQSGTDLDGLAKGVNKLSKEMGKAPEKFRAIGVSASDPLEAFAQFADVFNNIENVQTRNAVAAAALGKSWETLAPALAEGGKGIRDIVEKGSRLSGITKEMADRADKFNDSLAELQTRATGLAVSVADPVVRAISRIIEQFTEGEKAAGGFWKAVLILGTSNPFRSPGEAVNAYRAELEGLQADLKRYKESNADTSAVESAMRTTRIRLDMAKAMQRQEALAGFEALGSPMGNEARGVSGAARKPSNGSLRDFIGGDGKAKVDPNLLFGSGKLDLKADMDKSMAALASRVGDPLKDLMAKYEEAAKVIDETRTPLEKLEATTKRLNELQASGVLQADDYGRAIQRAQDDFAESVGKSGDALDEFSKNAAKNIQESLADFLFDPFKDGLKGMVDGFAATVRRIVADAAAADLTRALFGKIAGGSGQGVLGNIFGTSLQNVFGNLLGGGTQSPAPVADALVRSLPGRASGGPVMAGRPYIVGEKRPEIFVPNQSGTILPGTQFGGTSVSQVNHFHVTGPIDRRSQQQIAMEVGAAAQRAMRRNG